MNFTIANYSFFDIFVVFSAVFEFSALELFIFKA